MSVFCILFYHYPEHQVDYDGATDYRDVSYGFYSQCYEGVSWLRLNNEGYATAFDYIPSMDIDILLMGSSHMEATNVMINENTASVLEALSGMSVYNIGMGQHGFLKCVGHLEAALKKYRPLKYVVIETSAVNFSDNELKKFFEESIEKLPAYDKGFFSFVHRIPYFRLLYRQYPNFITKNILSPRAVKTLPQKEKEYNSDEMLAKFFVCLKSFLSPYDAKLIIAYHPSIALNDNGTLKILSEQEDTAQFSELCKQNGIYFVDMSQKFLDEYAKNFSLPYGFINTSIGNGHMNKYGHRMFAEEIYNMMREIERDEDTR